MKLSEGLSWEVGTFIVGTRWTAHRAQVIHLIHLSYLSPLRETLSLEQPDIASVVSTLSASPMPLLKAISRNQHFGIIQRSAVSEVLLYRRHVKFLAKQGA